VAAARIARLPEYYCSRLRDFVQSARPMPVWTLWSFGAQELVPAGFLRGLAAPAAAVYHCKST
jgi:hypothetical protein